MADEARSSRTRALATDALRKPHDLEAVDLEEITFRRYPRFSDLLRLFMLAVIKNLECRQLVILWRVKGMLSLLSGRRNWGTEVRKGFSSGSEAPTSWPALISLSPCLEAQIQPRSGVARVHPD